MTHTSLTSLRNVERILDSNDESADDKVVCIALAFTLLSNKTSIVSSRVLRDSKAAKKKDLSLVAD